MLAKILTEKWVAMAHPSLPVPTPMHIVLCQIAGLEPVAIEMSDCVLTLFISNGHDKVPSTD